VSHIFVEILNFPVCIKPQAFEEKGAQSTSSAVRESLQIQTRVKIHAWNANKHATCCTSTTTVVKAHIINNDRMFLLAL